MGSLETMRRFRHTLLAWLRVAALLGAVSAPASVAADAFSTWTPGPGAAGDNTYAGFIDVPPANTMVPTGNFQVAGWFVDTTADGWAGADDVQVFLGTMDGGGKMLAKAFFAQSRSHVAAALANPYWAGYRSIWAPSERTTARSWARPTWASATRSPRACTAHSSPRRAGA